MRVLLLANHYRPGPGGAEAVLLATERLLRERGHQPVPFAVREPDAAPTPWAAWFPPMAGTGGADRGGPPPGRDGLPAGPDRPAPPAGRRPAGRRPRPSCLRGAHFVGRRRPPDPPGAGRHDPP